MAGLFVFILVSLVGSTIGACPHIVKRAEWGARTATNIQYLSKQPVQYAYIHHSAGTECHTRASCAEVTRADQNYHMDGRGYSDIGYSFVIGGDGSIFEGRGWDRVGAHTLHHNTDGLGICLSGNFMTHLPTTAQMNAAKALIQCGVSLGKISSSYILKGHRDVRATLCPGDMLYKEIKTWPHYQ